MAGAVMGTTWNATVVVTSPEESRKAAALQPRVQAALDEVDRLMSTYKPESEISRFNAHASTEAFEVSALTAEVVRKALDVGARTGGGFDVTLGPLIALWGFDKDGRRSKPPKADALAAARARVGLDKIKLEGTKLSKTAPDVQINLSGIAKGFGADRAAGVLFASGFAHAMVEVGGEVSALGTNARGVVWRIGINVPRSGADPTAVLRTVGLHDRALATSGDYRNFFESGGRRYSHIIDPSKGEPVLDPPVSVSVVAKDCATADALATAGMVVGEEKLREAIKGLNGVEVLFVRADAGTKGGFVVSHTDGFPLVEPQRK
jgi:thiamine biosynthesis lipoprotein